MSALFALLALIVTAPLTFALERLFRSPTQEAGPAATPPVTKDIKLLGADRWLYPAGTVSAFLGVLFAFTVIPFSPTLIAEDLGIGAFYFIVVVDFVVLGVALTGWGANTPKAVDAYYRITAQLISYIIPLGLAYVGALMMAESLSMVTIVEKQTGLWFIVLQPVGFALYIITGLMQAYRAPFLEAFSGSIDHGVLGVVGGWQALLWRVSLAGLFFAVAAMGAVLYLGGWLGPWLPGPVWMLLKTFGLMALMLYLGQFGQTAQHCADAQALLAYPDAHRAGQRPRCRCRHFTGGRSRMILGAVAQVVAFTVLSLIAVLGALGMATTMSMYRSGIFLMASFIGVSGLFILLSADLLGLLQVMMYIAAGCWVMILFMALFSHDPGGDMMAGMDLPLVEKFFSLGLLPKDEEKVEAAQVEEIPERHEADTKNAQHDHQQSENEAHGGHEDQHDSQAEDSHEDGEHEGHGESEHGGHDMEGHDMEGHDHGDMDMSMVTPVRPWGGGAGACYRRTSDAAFTTASSLVGGGRSARPRLGAAHRRPADEQVHDGF